MDCATSFMNPKWPSLHLHGLSSMGEQNVYLTLQLITLSSISEITINEVPLLKGNICNDYMGWFITCASNKAAFPLQANAFSPASFQTKGCSYLFHIFVVHGVVRHFIWLQFNNLFELIAITFPLADNDHFIKQENIPADTHSQLLLTQWKDF